LAENSEAIGLDVSAEGSITDLLGSPQRWLGWSAEQMIGKTLVELLDPDDCAELQRIMQGAGSLSGEFLVRCADGRQRWVAHESHAVTDESGTATGVISTWRDAQGEVAHRRELRDSAQQARDLADLHEIARSRAVEAVEAKTVFLSEMSEELRTPLNIILGFAQLLEMDDLTADQRASLRHITQAAQAQLTLINDILDVSRLERGTISLSVEPVGVSEILAQVADQMKVPAGHGDVSLAIPQDIDPTLQVQVDRQRALQILVRIVGNAIRFSGAGGQVTVACHDHGATVAIAVSDTGPGIDPAAAAELFSPFTRKDPNRGVSHSAGIGLAVARGLALAMDGSIEVQSTPGQGATFTLELPKGQLDHRTGVDGSDDPGTAGHLTVVYIEDNPANALLLTKITQLRANVTCLVAPTGLEGLALVASERPDLVFLDLHLPDIDGAECLRRLRADPATQDLPVVIVTADAATSLHRQLIDLGATCTMTKPVSIADVLTWLDNPTGPNP
jgi:PAS domain S-box-containing protein